MTAKPNIRDMSLEEIEALISSLGKQKYRARQIMKWLYTGGATSFAEMTTLARDFRTRMEGLTRIAEPTIDRIQTSQDGTKKILFRIEGNLFIESVLIPGREHGFKLAFGHLVNGFRSLGHDGTPYQRRPVWH